MGFGDHIPREAFLSHSSANRKFARKLARTLNAHGVTTWHSESSLQGADQWHDEIGEALSRCDWFLLLLTPPAVQSKWVKRELLYALDNDQYQDHIVPILYRPCDFIKLSWALRQIQFVDFKASQREGLRQLLAMWGIGFDPSKL